MNETALIIMAKKPIVGRTKTRLCPPLSPVQATELYEALLLDTIDLCTSIEFPDLYIAVTPPESMEYFNRIKPEGSQLIPVECPDIGDCLAQVMIYTSEMGYEKSIALNSDGPSLPPEYIYLAEQVLDDHDIVFGLGEDGGYYLVGMKAVHIDLFYGIEWSTPRVLKQSLDKAAELGLRAAQTPSWYDIDTMDEVIRFLNEIDKLPPERLIHSRSFFLNTEISLEGYSE